MNPNKKTASKARRNNLMSTVYCSTPLFDEKLNTASAARRNNLLSIHYSRLLIPGGRFLNVAPELPERFKELVVGGVPQSSSMQVGAQLPDRRHELTGPHLGDRLGQILKSGERILNWLVRPLFSHALLCDLCGLCGESSSWNFTSQPNQIAYRPDRLRRGQIADSPVQMQPELAGQHVVRRSQAVTFASFFQQSEVNFVGITAEDLTCQVISTLLSAGISSGAGGESCLSDRQNAQRQSTFQCGIPVRVLSRISGTYLTAPYSAAHTEEAAGRKAPDNSREPLALSIILSVSSLPNDHTSHASSGVIRIARIAGNDVDMNVHHRLARVSTHVNADVVARRPQRAVDPFPRRLNQF